MLDDGTAAFGGVLIVNEAGALEGRVLAFRGRFARLERSTSVNDIVAIQAPFRSAIVA